MHRIGGATEQTCNCAPTSNNLSRNLRLAQPLEQAMCIAVISTRSDDVLSAMCVAALRCGVLLQQCIRHWTPQKQGAASKYCAAVGACMSDTAKQRNIYAD